MRRPWPLVACITACCLLPGLAGTPARAGEIVMGVASVVDGDTLEIHGERVRLSGIDAPESRRLRGDAGGQPYRRGQKAALALADRIDRRAVACEGRTRDRYGRLVATCFLGAEGPERPAGVARPGPGVPSLRHAIRPGRGGCPDDEDGPVGGTF